MRGIRRRSFTQGTALLSAIASLTLAAPLAAIAPWSAAVGVLNQTPLEMAQALPGVDVGGTRMPVAIVFNSVPRFRLGLVDPAGAGSMSFVTIDSAGVNFALGTIAETTAGRIGGSYVTSSFDLRFWTCLAPCSSVQTFAIDTAATWIDSNSAASGGLFVVAGLDNATGFVHLYTSPDGAIWTPLRSITPAGGFYRNFDGGERLGLGVDPVAALAAQATPDAPEAVGMNCVFAEALLAFPIVEKRVECANGLVPIPYTPIVNDVQDPGGLPSPEIENRVFLEAGAVVGVFTRRQDGKVYQFRFPPGGVPTLVQIGNAPTGPEFFGLSISGRYSYSRSRVSEVHAELGVRIDFIADDATLAPAGSGPGPLGPEGPIVLLPSPPGCLEIDCDQLHAVLPTEFFFDQPEGTTVGVGLAKRRIAAFEDGFAAGGTTRWSVTTP